MLLRSRCDSSPQWKLTQLDLLESKREITRKNVKVIQRLTVQFRFHFSTHLGDNKTFHLHRQPLVAKLRKFRSRPKTKAGASRLHAAFGTVTETAYAALNFLFLSASFFAINHFDSNDKCALCNDITENKSERNFPLVKNGFRLLRCLIALRK